MENVEPHASIAYALAQNKLGTVAEIYYDWCWEDVYEMMEIVDISAEIQRKETLKAEMQNMA